MLEKLSYPRKTALETPATLATVIHAIVIDKYGEKAYQWEPITVFLELKDDFSADTCPEAMDRWCAIQTVMTTDAFYTRLDAFLNICNTLASGSPAFDVFNPVTPEEAAWGVAEVALNRESLPFSYAIKKYLRTALAEEGYSKGNLPPIFNEVFSNTVDEKDTRGTSSDIQTSTTGTKAAKQGLAVIGNNENIDMFINGMMDDISSQFDRIPDLSRVDDLLTDHGLDRAMDI